MLKKCRLRSPCRCGSSEGLILPGSSPHCGKLLCWECGRHQKWLAKKDYALALSKGLVNDVLELEAIAYLLNEITGVVIGPEFDNIPELSPIPRWNLNEAKSMAKANYRQTYLDK
jgi:hypothetical protein